MSWATFPAAYSQSETDRKVRLMSEALEARNSGDLDTAKTRLLELQEITPNDASVGRILSQVEAMIDERDKAVANAMGGLTADQRAALQNEAEYLARVEAERIEKLMDSAREVRDVGLRQSRRGDFDAATATIEKAIGMLEPNPMTQPLIDDLQRELGDVLRQKSAFESKKAEVAAGMDDAIPIEQINPDFVDLQQEIEALTLRGRSQFFAGDIDGAEATFKQIESIDPNNAMAKSFLVRISRERQSMAYLNKLKTREQMIEEISSAWQRPGIYEERPDISPTTLGPAPLLQKLNSIVIPNVNFTEVSLNVVVNTLSTISEEFDATSSGQRGVNLVLLDPDRANPTVNITLRNLSLKRILDFIVDSVGFQYEVQQDAVVLRPGGEKRNLNTDVFPVSRSTVIRMTGVTDSTTLGAGNNDDPFAVRTGTEAPVGGMAQDAQTIKYFLQQAGVDFDGVDGATLAYDGSAMIVTQSTRNLERIRNILNRYTDVKQVEIEAKFLEVKEGVIEELGFDWVVTDNGLRVPDGNGGFTGTGEQYRSSLRTLESVNSTSRVASNIIINGEPVAQLTPPDFPGTVPLGTGSVPFTNVFGTINGLEIDVAVRALSQQEGSDLLSAPKVTVLSGNRAEMNVSQEFRYPTRYSDTESNVGTTSGSLNGGSAGVTITAGTPEDFETRNVGVELSVTPIVEEDDYSITLEMNPRVTEFEGFVEYGGSSLAISGNQTVTVPSGFYQPIFSVREVSTKVTIWDGATVVMGGLTREEIVSVSDKVPFFGDIPLFGRLFRSEGEASSKRNLLIFVTANLVSPGGSPKRQSMRGVSPGSMFQNPTIVTPGGSESRGQ
ncbi:MAG: type II secretory pathway, component PulD [Verrucomicrobiota bacterium]